ncbi:MAG: hypothetical protein ACRD3V_11325 [Vicinamibacteria bacterium]
MSEPRIDAFVNTNWHSLARAAYRNFLKLGKGMLFLHFDSLDRWENGDGFTLQPAYVTTYDDDKVERIIATYDPETELVIGFTDDEVLRKAITNWNTLTKGSRISVWNYKIKPSPKEIHFKSAH